MISTTLEYEKAQEELRDLTERLQKLQQSHPGGSKGLTKAGVRKMIRAPARRTRHLRRQRRAPASRHELRRDPTPPQKPSNPPPRQEPGLRLTDLRRLRQIRFGTHIVRRKMIRGRGSMVLSRKFRVILPRGVQAVGDAWQGVENRLASPQRFGAPGSDGPVPPVRRISSRLPPWRR